MTYQEEFNCLLGK